MTETAHAGLASAADESVAGGAPAATVWPADIAIAVLLMCVSFAVNWIVGVALFDARVSGQRDVWFQLDADDFFAHRFTNLFRHPNIGLFLGAPLTAVADVLGFLGVRGDAPDDVQYWLMLGLAPAANAVRTLAAFRALRPLTGDLALTVMLCLLDIAAFSTVALGSMPESFPVSAMAITALYWLFSAARGGEPMRWGRWIALGTFAAGVTQSNLMPLAILVGATLLARGAGARRVVVTTTAVVLAVVALTAVLAVGTSLVTGQPLSERLDADTERFFRAAPTRPVVTEVALAMGHTFVAPPPVPVPGSEPPSANPDYDFQLLLPTAAPDSLVAGWREGLTVLLLALGTTGFLRRRHTALWLLPGAALVAANFVLHLFFGHHFFIYSLHWTFSMVWIMAGVAFLPRPFRTAAVTAVGVFLVVTAVNSAILMRDLLAYLGGA